MGEWTGKRLALIGTENGASDVAEFCKKEGITLVSFGNKPEAKIHGLSDEQCVVDCTDAAVMIPLLKEKRIDGVFLCTGEKVIRSCIPFLREAGYRHYSTPEQWEILMNKKNFKEASRKFGISTVPEFQIDAQTGKIIGDVSFPVVVKPAVGSGSVGISVCHTAQEVAQAVPLAQKNNKASQVICEKFLSGPFFFYEIWLREGKAYFPYVKERISYPQIGSHPQQPFIDMSPASFRDLIQRYYFDKTEKFFHSLGIENGACWFQGIIEDGIPYIMDTGFRLSGGQDWRVVKEETGIDLIENHVRYALGGTFGGDLSALKGGIRNSYAIVCVGLKNGTIQRIQGIDKINALPFVMKLHQYYAEGSTVKTSGLFSQTLCRIYVKGADQAELKQNVAQVLEVLEAVDADGNSLLLDYPQEYYRWLQVS